MCFRKIFALLLISISANLSRGQSLLSTADLQFLKEMTLAVLDSSRILPGQQVGSFGRNNSGGTLVRPGGKDAYPSFWIRDYAMALESGFISLEEQRHMLLLTASTQNDQTWITRNGSMVPAGAIADHIRIDDSKPIYFPGTYSFLDQGNKQFGMVPPYCDQFYFIGMASYYIAQSGNSRLLLRKINGTSLIDRLELAFRVPPSRLGNHLVYTTAEYRGVDFGFRDAIEITGDLCFASILKLKAAQQLESLFKRLKNAKKSEEYRNIAIRIREALPKVFMARNGMLLASTGTSKQADVWSTALAVYYDILTGDSLVLACRALADAYQKGNLAFKGNIRHIPLDGDYSVNSAWEKSMVPKNEYQNGAYWGTPTGWVCYAISRVDEAAARQLAREYISDLRENDFRKGASYGAPYECFYPPTHRQNPLYLATVVCPYIVFNTDRR